ncbi:hypothetical protein Cadr_000031249, partial [Camelus dromedarius]
EGGGSDRGQHVKSSFVTTVQVSLRGQICRNSAQEGQGLAISHTPLQESAVT